MEDQAHFSNAGQQQPTMGVFGLLSESMTLNRLCRNHRGRQGSAVFAVKPRVGSVLSPFGLQEHGFKARYGSGLMVLAGFKVGGQFEVRASSAVFCSPQGVVRAVLLLRYQEEHSAHFVPLFVHVIHSLYSLRSLFINYI